MVANPDNLHDRVIRIVESSVASGLHATVGEAAKARGIAELNLIEDLCMDSVQILSLLMSLEEEFGLELDEADVYLEKLMRVQALIDFVVRKTAARPAESVA